MIALLDINSRFNRLMLFLGMLFTLFMVVSCDDQEEAASVQEWHCDAEESAEEGDKRGVTFISQGNRFQGGYVETEHVYEGKQAIRVDGERNTGAFFSVEDVKVGDVIEVDVMRYGKAGALVVSDAKGEVVYAMIGAPIQIEGEWERLHLSVAIHAPVQDNRINVYVYSGVTETYFDELNIQLIGPSDDRSIYGYQAYEEKESFALLLEDEDLEQLEYYRDAALKSPFIPDSCKRNVPAQIVWQGDTMKAKIRLKGDWHDHIRGRKWSFRIKLEDGFWHGMREFSIQNPMTRGGIYEWMIHDWCRREDVLATRYGFAPVMINGQSLGVYAWEEHPDKQLVESLSRREGPILKLDDAGFWEVIHYNDKTGKWPTVTQVEAAIIQPFAQKRTRKSVLLTQQFELAQTLWEQYRFSTRPASEIYNVDQLGKLYAIYELVNGEHALFWHNQRVYYNPISGKLEPIAYDCNGGSRDDATPFGLRGQEEGYGDFSENMRFSALNDEKVYQSYLRYLKRFSSATYLDSMTQAMALQYDSYQSQLKIENPFDTIDGWALVHRQAASMLSYWPALESREQGSAIHPSHISEVVDGGEAFRTASLNTWCETTDAGSRLYFRNYGPDKITVRAIVGKDEEKIDLTVEVPPAKAFPLAEVSVRVPILPDSVVFRVEEKNQRFASKIWHWVPPSLEKQHPLQALRTNPVPEAFAADAEGKLVISGSHEVSSTVYVHATQIVIQPGTEITFVGGGSLIFTGTVQALGTPAKPIVFRSRQNAWGSVLLLEALGVSRFSHVRFEGLDAFAVGGWRLTGGVTAYESDVEFTSCTFYDARGEDALNIVRSDFVLDQCHFEFVASDAFDADFCTGVVSNCHFESVINDGVDVSGSKVQVSDCVFRYSYDKGISAGEASEVEVSNVEITGSGIGMACKDLSHLSVRTATLTDCDYGFVAFTKKGEYGPAEIEVQDITMEKVIVTSWSEIGSMIGWE